MPAISAGSAAKNPVSMGIGDLEAGSTRRAKGVKTTGESLLEAVKSIEPILREHAQESEERSRLAKPVVEAMRQARLFAMWIPKSLGGLELDPMSAFRVVEEVSRIDSAAGWNLQLSIAAGPFGAWLPDEGAEEIYSKDLIMAGALFPPAQAVPVEGGYRVTGRTPFVSGCHHCSWFIAPAHVMERTGPRTENGEPVTVLAFLPASDGEIVDNWDTLGMRGTGSHDVAIRDKFVPKHHTGFLGPS
jgi:indole-3-acetate monooxygenase